LGPKVDAEIAAPKQKDHIMHRAAKACSLQSANGSGARGGRRSDTTPNYVNWLGKNKGEK